MPNLILDRLGLGERRELKQTIYGALAKLTGDGEDPLSPPMPSDVVDMILSGEIPVDKQFDAKALQNRDRSRQAYVMQMQKIASNPDYDRISISKTPDTGAPMVFTRGVHISPANSGRQETITMSDGKGGSLKIPSVYAIVEAKELLASHDAAGSKVESYGGSRGIMALNNGRTAALKQAYKQDTAEDYRKSLIADEANHGISRTAIENLNEPVLVRVFSESAISHLADPGAASNVLAGAALSASEQAETDAKKLDDAVLMQYQGGDVNSVGNRDFVRAFIRSMGGSDAVGDMQTADGMISADGVKRIESALVAKAYGDNAILNDLTESPDSELKSLGNVLKDVAGRWAVMASAARDGAISKGMDITPQLNEAITLIRKARQQGKRISELVNQNDMFSGQTNPVTEALLRLMFRGDDMSRVRSADKIAKALHGFLDQAVNTVDGADMFGHKPDPMELIAQQKGNLEADEQAGKTQKGLFDSVAEYFDGWRMVFDSLADAAKDVETSPTDAQKQSGNYRKGHAVVHGLPVTIENPKGSTRSGTSPYGGKWSNTMNAHYGYIKGSKGADGDHVDVYFGDGAEGDNPRIFVVNQMDPETGDFDEHKVMFGYPDAETAKKAYLGNFEKGWGGFGSIKKMSLVEFKDWLNNGDTTKELKPIPVDQIFDSAGETLSLIERRNIKKQMYADIALLSSDIGLLERRKIKARIMENWARLSGDSVTNETPVDAKNQFGMEKGEGKVTRENINSQVKQLVAQIQAGKDPATLTPEELALFRKYSGKDGLDDNSQDQYYTPAFIAEGMWDLLNANGIQNGNILEPSTGAGVFSATKPKGVRISGTEIDPIAATVNAVLHPEDSIQNSPFEVLASTSPDNSYDSVIGNVPFGNRNGKTLDDDKAYRSEKLLERYFINRAIDKCKPGGLVVLVVPTRVVEKKDSGWQKFRAQVSRKAEFLGAHKLPQGTFGQQGTETATDIVIFKKHPSDLADKIKSLPTETLEVAKVLWQEFIGGNYWKGEGKPFYHGTFIPKSESGFRDQVKRDPSLTDAALKAKLSARFDSRIDWEMLDSAQAVVNAYSEGDTKMINGVEHRFENGDWVQVRHDTPETDALDAETYGVASVAQLQDVIQDPKSMLALNNQQAFKAYKKFPAAFGTHQKHAVDFSQSQALDKHREIAYRGSLIGSMVVRYTSRLPEIDEVERDALITALKSEYALYGHPSNLNGFMLNGEMSKYFGAFIGAIDKDGNISSTITEGVSKAEGFRSKDVQSIVEYLFKQGESPITLDAIAAIYDGDKSIKTVGDIADIEHIAITPEGLVLPRNKYCSGMVYERISDLQAAMTMETDERVKQKWQSQIEVMSKAAKWSSIDDINFGMGERWTGRKYLAEFLKQQGYSAQYITFSEVEKTDPDTGKKYKSREGITQDNFDVDGGEWNIGSRSKESGFTQQLEHWLNGKRLGHNVKDKGGKSAEERTKDYQEQLDGLEDMFNMFMKQHEDAQDLEAKYNYAFNGYVTPDYDQDDLGLTDTSGQVKPHWYQNAGIRQLSEEGRGILGFDVGLGKTFSALAFSSFDRKMGRSKKHCIVVPKSVLANWYHEARSFYSSMDDVMFVGFEPLLDKKTGEVQREPVLDENGNPKTNKYTGNIEYQDKLKIDSPEDKYKKMHSIPFTSKKLVVMTKETFNAIPMRGATKAHYIDKMVERNMVSDSIAAKENGKKSYQDDVTETKLSQQFADDGGRKKDEYPYFEEMGFDRVIVDEAHHFKNSYGVGKDISGLAYLPSPQSASIARGMAMKMAYLRDKNDGKGSILLTATPVSNSPIEIYNMLTLVIPPEEFERYGVHTPDDFIKTFGIIGMVDKVGIDGQVKSREGLKGFRKLRALRGIFHRYANMKAPKDVDPDGNSLKLPKAIEVIDRVAMDDDQTELYASLREEATKSANPKNKGRPMFAVIRDMDRVTTDIDMYDEKITYIFKKSNQAAVDALIADLKDDVVWMKEDPATGELSVMTGKGTKKESDTVKKITIPVERNYKVDGDSIIYRPSAYSADQIDSRFEKFGIDYVSHPLRPKYAKLIENMQAELDGRGKQIVFTEEKSQHTKIKRIIVNHLPVAESQIAIINADTADGDKLQDISDAYNRGDFRIIIANKKAEVGVNLQKGTTAIHHLTLPWNPASIQQRNGRGVRQGNTVENVRVFYYQATGSFDEYRLDLLKKKGNWISNLMDKESDEDEAENSDAMGAMEMAALMSSDKEAFWKKVAEKEEKRKAADLKRKHDNARSRLHQLSSMSIFIKNFDKILADRLTELDADISDAERIMNDHRAKGDTEKADKKAAQIETIKKRKAYVTLDMNGKLKQRTALVSQIKGSLQAAGKKGDLPFDADIVNNPESFIVTRSGVLLAVGKYYNYDHDHDRSIIKVIAVDQLARKVTYQLPLSRNYETTKNADDMVGLVETDLSASDIAWKSLDEDQWFDYAKLTEVSRATFDKMKSDLSPTGWMRRAKVLSRGEDGRLAFSRWVANDKQIDCIYPDANDEALKKELVSAYRDAMYRKYEKSIIRIEDYPQFMPIFFGGNWKDFALNGLPFMQPQELDESISTAMSESIGEYRTKWLESAKSKSYQDSIEETLDALQAEIGYVRMAVYDGVRSKLYMKIHDAVVDDFKSGNFLNIDDIRPAMARALNSHCMALSGQIATLKAEVDKRELERLEKEKAEKDAEKRANPNFKEVPPEWVKKFSDINLDVWINDEAVKDVPAFSAIFIKDRMTRGGKLFPAKDILKARYKAQFFGDRSFVPARYTNTWRVPSDTLIEKLFDIID